jgi:hypothetical protein
MLSIVARADAQPRRDVQQLARGRMFRQGLIYLQDSPKTCYIKLIPFVLLMSTKLKTSIRAEPIMSTQPKDTSKPVDQPDKKKSETVQLTAEDLRAISGGVHTPTLAPIPQVKVVKPNQ